MTKKTYKLQFEDAFGNVVTKIFRNKVNLNQFAADLERWGIPFVVTEKEKLK